MCRCCRRSASRRVFRIAAAAALRGASPLHNELKRHWLTGGQIDDDDGGSGGDDDGGGDDDDDDGGDDDDDDVGSRARSPPRVDIA